MLDQTIQTELKALVAELKQAKEAGDSVKAKDLSIQIVNKLSGLFVEEAKLFLQTLPGKPQTTKDNYGDYMQVLSGMTGMYRLAFAKALVDNGGSKAGVDSAMQLLNPNTY